MRDNFQVMLEEFSDCRRMYYMVVEKSSLFVVSGGTKNDIVGQKLTRRWANRHLSLLGKGRGDGISNGSPAKNSTGTNRTGGKKI